MGLPLWTWLLPVLAVVLLMTGALIPVGLALAILCSAALIGAVIASVHHAEVVAHRLCAEHLVRGVSSIHHQLSRANLQPRATRVRRTNFAGAVDRLRVCPDRATPGLLSTG